MKLLLSITLLIVSSLPGLAQQKTPPPPGPARPLNLPKLTEKKLANGLTVVLAPLPNVPKVSAILTFRAATDATDRTSHPGIAQIAAGVANGPSGVVSTLRAATGHAWKRRAGVALPEWGP